MQKLNFLVVDDAAFIRDLIKRTLKSQFHQCQIDEAINGKKGQTMLGKRRYDLIFCDWEMPEMSGMELLRWFRAYEAENELEKTPFMMVTSRGEKSHVVKAVESGVSDYIGKPFSQDQLLRKSLKLLAVNHRELVRSILKGTAKMAPAAGGASAFDSASVLTAKPVEKQSAKPAAEKKGSASLLTSGSPTAALVDKDPVRAQKAGKRNLGKVSLRSPNESWQGILRAVSLTDAAIQIEFGESKPPSVLEQVVIDIQPKGHEVARINAFITSVTLQEKALDCYQAEIHIHIVDDDADKIEILSHFVAEVR